MRALEITYVSHACLRIEGEFGSLLCDPWFLNEPVYSYVLWKFPAAVIPPDEVVHGLDYLYITHSHEDHFHVPSIDHIPRDVQVLLPEYAHHSSLRAQLVERVLRGMGFSRIRKLQSWETYLLGGNTPLTVIPSARSRGHDWENSGFVIEHHDCRMINMNDNVDDEELCAEIHQRFEDFDIGFIQTAGVTVFPACYRMPPAEKEERAQNKKENFSLHDRLIRMLHLKRVAPFAGDFGWLADEYFSYNWLGRSSPRILEKWIHQSYPDRQVTTLYPSDQWSMKTEVVRNHPEIDWDDYVDEVRKLKQKFQRKVDAYTAWLEASNRTQLRKRSRQRTELVNRWIKQEFIDFTASFRISVEGEHSNFSFVCRADPERGFRIDWNDAGAVDQTIHVPERVWASVLEGKIMWGQYQWATQIEEHVPYRLDIGRLWYWMEYHVDLGNKSIQAIIEPQLFPALQHPTIRPQFGVVAYEDDWDRSWLEDEGASAARGSRASAAAPERR